jgi:hypothetical protein
MAQADPPPEGENAPDAPAADPATATAELDLTQEPADPASPQGLAPPDTKPYDPERDREAVRGRIALLLIWILAGIIVASFLTVWGSPDKFPTVKSLLELIIAPVVALVGSATGFYFGGKSK